MIPKSVKNAYQSFQNKQHARQALHDAKRGAAQGFRKGDTGGLGKVTADMTHVLQHLPDGKVLHVHGNKNHRITANAASVWSRFKSEVPLRVTQLHARNAIKTIAEGHLQMSAGDASLEQLANDVLALLPKDNVKVTEELRQAMNALNAHAQGLAARTAAQPPVGQIRV
jgi:LmbE family N-acetylglucosaminyl deacetylase